VLKPSQFWPPIGWSEKPTKIGPDFGAQKSARISAAKSACFFQWVSFLGFEASKTHALFGTSFWAQILECKSVNKNRSQFPRQNQA